MTKKFFAVFILICILVTTVSVTANADAPYREPGYINHYSAYYIRNAKSGLYLDLQASGTTNGTHFQQYTFGDPSEVFTLISVSTDVYAVKSTFYNAEGRSMVMDGRSNCVAGAQVILYNYLSGATEQAWRFTKNSDGTYSLSPQKNPSLCLAIEGGSTASHAKAKLAAKNTSDLSQRWYFEYVPDATGVTSTGMEYFFIRNKHSGLYLDLQRSSTESGTHFQQYQFGQNGCPSEKFTISDRNGYGLIETSLKSRMVMDGRSNCVAGAQVILYPRVSEAPEQDWYFRRNDDGTYCISPKKNVYLNLAVEGSSTSNNAKVKLEARASSDNQKWYLEPVSAADFQPKYMFPDPENGVTPYRNVSSGYKTSERPTHYALDIIGKNADISYQKIYSPTSGTVVFSNYTGEAGYYVIIESDMCRRGTGKKIKYTFGHLAWKSELKVGQRILPWDFIGYVGDTGDPDPVYGPPGFHLHTAIFHVKNNARLWPDGDNCHNPQFFHSNTDFVGKLSSTSP